MNEINILPNVKDEIVKLHIENGWNINKIAKYFHIKYNQVEKVLKQKGAPLRKGKYENNESFFEKIDSEAKAYFLGLLYADGCLNNKNGFSIKLQEEDGYILERFRDLISPKRPIHIYKKKIGKTTKCFSITNKKIYSDLIRLGLFPRKSTTLPFPTEDQVPNEFIYHFLRGVLDGDGWINIAKGDLTKIKIGFCLSLNFGKSLQLFLLKNLNINSQIYPNKRKTIYMLNFGGRKQAIRFCKKICQETDQFYLKRKREKMLNILNHKTKQKGESVYYGVHPRKNKNGVVVVYEVFFHLNKKMIYIGRFTNEKAAAKAYNNKIKELNLQKDLNDI